MVEVDAILEKYDPEARYLKLTGHWVTLIKIIAVCFSLFQLYTAMFGLLEAQIQRPTHLMFALTLIYLLYPTKKPKKAGSGGLQIHPVDIILSPPEHYGGLLFAIYLSKPYGERRPVLHH